MKIHGAYGSNMNLSLMTNRCPNCHIIGKGILKDYKMVFRGKGDANVKQSKGDQVPIVLWELTDECEEKLDIYEEYPEYYSKKDLIVDVGDEKVSAMFYVMNEEYENIVEAPSETYYNAIYQGYISNGIPVQILEKVLDENKREIENLKK